MEPDPCDGEAATTQHILSLYLCKVKKGEVQEVVKSARSQDFAKNTDRKAFSGLSVLQVGASGLALL